MFTVFFDEESGILPQDFQTLREATELAEEKVRQGLASGYQIEFVDGDIV